MGYYDYNRITFTNQNFNFEFFYKSMEKTMIDLTSEINLFKCNKILTAFIGNFFYGIADNDYGEKIEEQMIKLNDDIISDTDIQKIIKYDEHNIDVRLEYTKKYYFYFSRIISLFGLFIESLNQTLMPNTYSSGKKVRYSNNLHFFVSYSKIKETISENLAEFSLEKFIKPINSIIVFYHGYHNFITESVRQDIELILNKLIEFISDKEFLYQVTKQKTNKELIELNKVKNNLYKIILKVYSKINEEHSLYDLNPKIEKKIYIDKTGM